MNGERPTALHQRSLPPLFGRTASRKSAPSKRKLSGLSPGKMAKTEKTTITTMKTSSTLTNLPLSRLPSLPKAPDLLRLDLRPISSLPTPMLIRSSATYRSRRRDAQLPPLSTRRQTTRPTPSTGRVSSTGVCQTVFSLRPQCSRRIAFCPTFRSTRTAIRRVPRNKAPCLLRLSPWMEE